MPAMDPNTPPIGRQPGTIWVKPSKSYPWYGYIVGGELVDLAPVMLVTVIRGGERFTEQQTAALIRLGRDPATVEAMTVRRQASDAEIYAAMRLPPVFAFDCPVIGTWRDRIKVIAPSGETKCVLPDGWAHHPYRHPRDQWGRAA